MSGRRSNLIDKHVGSRVRMRRLSLGMSQQDLADRADITFQQIQKYEKGANRISASRLYQFSGVLNVPLLFFFEGLPTPGGGPKKQGEPPSPDYITDLLTKREGHALARAFLRIKKNHIRHAIVRVVEAIAISHGA